MRPEIGFLALDDDEMVEDAFDEKALGALLSGGNQYVESGGQASGIIVDSGGADIIESGGTGSSATVSAVGARVVFGGVASCDGAERRQRVRLWWRPGTVAHMGLAFRIVKDR